MVRWCHTYYRIWPDTLADVYRTSSLGHTLSFLSHHFPPFTLRPLPSFTSFLPSSPLHFHFPFPPHLFPSPPTSLGVWGSAVSSHSRVQSVGGKTILPHDEKRSTFLSQSWARVEWHVFLFFLFSVVVFCCFFSWLTASGVARILAEEGQTCASGSGEGLAWVVLSRLERFLSGSLN